MPKIFADLSGEALRRVSEEHYVDSFTCFSIVPGVEVFEGDDMVRVASPEIPNPITNAVLRCRFSAHEVDTIIDQTNLYFRSKGVVPYWRLCPSDLPPDLEEHLTRKGLALVEVQPAMAVDLERLNQDTRPQAGLTITRIMNVQMLKEQHVWISQLLRERKPFGTLLLRLWSAFGFDEDSVWQHYVGLLDGKPVSVASVFYATGVAGIYAVITVPEARGRGIGSAMTLRPLLDAHKRGYRVGLLQSSQMGYGVYRRLGFQTCFDIKVFAPSPWS